MRLSIDVSEADALLILRTIVATQTSNAEYDAAVDRVLNEVRRATRESLLPKEPPVVKVSMPVEIINAKAKMPHDFEAAMAAMNTFCDANAILPPTVETKHGIFAAERTTTALYNRVTRLITVFVDHAVTPVVVTATGISEERDVQLRKTWPGWLEDYTVLGAVCHELGHHVQKEKGWKKVDQTYYDPYTKEAPLSMYARSSRPEDFAESFRLFVINPTLLEALCPLRYAYFTVYLKLRTIEDRHWSLILEDSPERVVFIKNRLGL